MVTKINVDKDIRLAETLPAKFYKDENLFDISKKKIFLRSWHWIGDDTLLKEKNPNNKKIPEVTHYVIQIYKKLNNKAKASELETELLALAPDSKWAKFYK